jgi:hypothetical protein
MAGQISKFPILRVRTLSMYVARLSSERLTIRREIMRKVGLEVAD